MSTHTPRVVIVNDPTTGLPLAVGPVTTERGSEKLADELHAAGYFVLRETPILTAAEFRRRHPTAPRPA